MTTVESLTGDGLRALFVVGITQAFFDLPNDRLAAIGGAIKDAFDDLSGRFGVTVLGTLDDDLLQVGASRGYPFISYILAGIPDLEAAIAVTNLIRTPFEDHRLARYLTIEARIGHPLFFGTA